MSGDIVDTIRSIHRRSERGRCTCCRGPFSDCLDIKAANEIEALRAQQMTAVRSVLTAAIVGESVHTALRKCDAVADMTVWNAIRDMPDAQWHASMELASEWLLDNVERAISEAVGSVCAGS